MTKRFAILYDFDYTIYDGISIDDLCMRYFEMDKGESWQSAFIKYAKQNDMDTILSYMYFLKKQFSEFHISFKETCIDFAKHMKFYDGLDTWFDNINAVCKDNNTEIYHFIISSGPKEVIKHSFFNDKIHTIFASEFLYDNNDNILWPKTSVSYVVKTQYVHRINKGIFNSYDDSSMLSHINKNYRYIPFENMIYIGDGDTDIPAMKLINKKGGKSIAVYDDRKGSMDYARKLNMQNRVHHYKKADYRHNSDLFNVVSSIIEFKCNSN